MEEAVEISVCRSPEPDPDADEIRREETNSELQEEHTLPELKLSPQ